MGRNCIEDHKEKQCIERYIRMDDTVLRPIKLGHVIMEAVCKGNRIKLKKIAGFA